MDAKEQSKNGSQALRCALVQPGTLSATQWLVDAVIACGAFGFGMLQMTLSVNLFLPDEFTRLMLGIQSVTPSALAIVAVLLTCAPLVVREKLPWVAFAGCLGFWVLFSFWMEMLTLSLVGPLVALFTVAYLRSRGESIGSGLVMLACVLAAFAFMPQAHSPFDSLMLLMNATLVIAVALAGYAFHVRNDYLKEAQARAAQAEQLQEAERVRAEVLQQTADAQADAKVQAERVRIAREVHDITAHSLSAVSIQAAAALRLMDADPAAAKEAVEAVRSIAKDSLGDMRSMVGVLRGEEAAEREPTEGTERMESLVTYLEDAGVTCTLFVQGYDRLHVPVHVDVALFGIAREACTNIVRHSGATHATIALREVEGGVVLFVCDDGHGIAQDADARGTNAAGHGIEGMRERVRLLDGTFSLTPSPEGGTCVSVMIPMAGKDAV